jgi:hypothetical protein
MDYDLASTILPLNVGADDQTEDGTAFCTAIDTDAYANWKSLTFIVNVATAIAYSAGTWVVQTSEDNSNWAAADADELIVREPSDQTKTTKVFHCGWVGKARYVKAAFNSGSPTGQITAVLGHPMSAPTFGEDIVGVEG